MISDQLCPKCKCIYSKTEEQKETLKQVRDHLAALLSRVSALEEIILDRTGMISKFKPQNISNSQQTGALTSSQELQPAPCCFPSPVLDMLYEPIQDDDKASKALTCVSSHSSYGTSTLTSPKKSSFRKVLVRNQWNESRLTNSSPPGFEASLKEKEGIYFTGDLGSQRGSNFLRHDGQNAILHGYTSGATVTIDDPPQSIVQKRLSEDRRTTFPGDTVPKTCTQLVSSISVGGEEEELSMEELKDEESGFLSPQEKWRLGEELLRIAESPNPDPEEVRRCLADGAEVDAPVMRRFIRKGDIGCMEVCLEVKHSINFEESPAYSCKVKETAAMLQLIVNRVLRCTHDNIDWCATENYYGHDVITNAAFHSKLSIVWPIVKVVPFFAEKVNQGIKIPVNWPVKKSDWSNLDSNDQQNLDLRHGFA